MWHNPNQRLRAMANAKKRERERLRKPFHIKRVIAHLVLPTSTESVPVRVILNDLTINGVGLFSPHSLIPGLEISVNITAPIELQIPSRIVWCQQHSANSHVLSAEPYSYRLGVEFIHSSDEKQESIRKLFEDISRDFLYSVRSK